MSRPPARAASTPTWAFVVANYPPHSGGVEAHVQAVARCMVRRGIAVTVFTCEEVGVRESEGVTVVGMGRNLEVGGAWGLPDAGPALSLPRDLSAWGVTQVSVHTRFFPSTWVGTWAAHRIGVPVMLTEHGGGPVATGSRMVTRAARVVDSTVGRRVLRTADRVVAVSQRSATLVRELSGRHAEVVGNGIDFGFWSETAGDSPPGDRLLFVGRLVREKGWRQFLALVAGDPLEAPAVLAGDGPELEKARAEARRLAIDDRLLIPGSLPREQLRELYASSVYVNPSVAAEGCQSTLLEAAAAGGRIATSDVGGAAEAQAAGAAIRIVPKRDLRRLARSITALRQDSGASPAGMKRYDWDQICDAYLRLAL